jgi:DNA-binding PadR family transcriptional regulator
MQKGRKDKPAPPWVKLDNDMLNSAAWTALPDKAVWVYIWLRKQWDFKKGGNDHLELPYSEVSWRMSRGAFFKAIQTLVEYGFIKYKQKGGLFKRPNVYALSDAWKDKSRKIVCTEGKEAIRLGYAKKPTHRDNTENLPQFQEKSTDDKSNV